MKITFLGTGTSCGVPELLCNCEVCRSTDPRDRRTRSSLLVQTDDATIIIDCGPDFRSQMLAAGQPRPDALLITHSHYDHIGGLDDLKPFSLLKPDGLPIYCRPDVAETLRGNMPYCFGPSTYPRPPRLLLNEIEAGTAFSIAPSTTVMPLQAFHNPGLEILGFRIGPAVYLTDCKIIPVQTLELIRNCRLLVIGALRHKPHDSHLNLQEALDVINYVKPERTLLTHISHGMGLHANARLPEGVELAYDGLTVNI